MLQDIYMSAQRKRLTEENRGMWQENSTRKFRGTDLKISEGKFRGTDLKIQGVKQGNKGVKQKIFSLVSHWKPRV
jgi:hypothetical protein